MSAEKPQKTPGPKKGALQNIKDSIRSAGGTAIIGFAAILCASALRYMLNTSEEESDHYRGERGDMISQDEHLLTPDVQASSGRSMETRIEQGSLLYRNLMQSIEGWGDIHPLDREPHLPRVKEEADRIVEEMWPAGTCGLDKLEIAAIATRALQEAKLGPEQPERSR